MGGWSVKYKSFRLNPDYESILKNLTEAAIAETADWLHKTLLSYIDQGRSDWPPLSEVTTWLRGGDAKVFDNKGDFKRAIELEVSGNYARVGILTPKGSEGQDMELIARVMEGGAMIRVSEKMRNWFAAQGRPLKKTTQVIVIPARPLFSPGVDVLEERVVATMDKILDDFMKVL